MMPRCNIRISTRKFVFLVLNVLLLAGSMTAVLLGLTGVIFDCTGSVSGCHVAVFIILPSHCTLVIALCVNACVHPSIRNKKELMKRLADHAAKKLKDHLINCLNNCAPDADAFAEALDQQDTLGDEQLLSLIHEWTRKVSAFQRICSNLSLLLYATMTDDEKQENTLKWKNWARLEECEPEPLKIEESTSRSPKGEASTSSG